METQTNEIQKPSKPKSMYEISIEWDLFVIQHEEKKKQK